MFLSDALREWQSQEYSNLFDGGSLVSRIIDRSADVSWSKRRLEDMAEDVDASPNSVVEKLVSLGYVGEEGVFDQYKYSQLDYVLRNHKGLPISFGWIAMCVADLVGLQNSGVDHPGHFLIMIEDELIDPFRMKLISYDSVGYEHFQADGFHQRTPVLCSNEELIGRMFMNLHALAISKNDQLRAFELSDYLEIVLPNSYQVPLTRAQIWVSLGDLDATRRECKNAIDLAPSEEIAEKVNSYLNLISWQSTQGNELN